MIGPDDEREIARISGEILRRMNAELFERPSPFGAGPVVSTNCGSPMPKLTRESLRELMNAMAEQIRRDAEAREANDRKVFYFPGSPDEFKAALAKAGIPEADERFAFAPAGAGFEVLRFIRWGCGVAAGTPEALRRLPEG